jgi:hypothetical protein
VVIPRRLREMGRDYDGRGCRMKRLGPGVYDDGVGGLHIVMSELLEANGYEDNAANRQALEDAARDLFGMPIEIVE